MLGIAEFRSVSRQSVRVDAATNGETLGFAGEQRAIGSGMSHVNRDHTAGGGLEVVLSPRLQRDGFASVLEQVLLVHLKFDEVVEVEALSRPSITG